MSHRAISTPGRELLGETMTLRDGDLNFALYLPPDWKAPADGKVALTINFHGAIWFAIAEHLRHGLKEPLLAANLGEGSSVYRQPFTDPLRLQRWLNMVAKQLIDHGAPIGTRITALDICSFSAGYGAVREIVRSPTYFKMIRRIVLSDSMYASFAGGTNLVETPLGLEQRPLPAQIAVWVPLARAAIRGEKTFAFTCSEVPTDKYANSTACAAALIAAVGAPVKTILPGSSPAASEAEYPLRFQSDLGNFHVWAYGGQDAQAHMTHPRHLADVWRELDRLRDP